MSIIWLRHNRIDLALHELRAGEGRALLLLHGLGERSPQQVPESVETWAGPVYALDFAGHGDSTVPVGGGYFAEILMADTDHALAHLGKATIVGRGLGAYVALMIAGGRPALVRGAILCDGPGLTGGGAVAPTPYILPAVPARRGSPDLLALTELSHDVRPPDYATIFTRSAVQSSGLVRPISVCAVERPEWLRAVTHEVGVEVTTFAEALGFYERCP